MLLLIKDILDKNEMYYKIQGKNRTIKDILAIESNLQDACCYFTGDDVLLLNSLNNCIVFINEIIKIDDLTKNNTYIISNNPQLLFYHCSVLFKEKSKEYSIDHVYIDCNTQLGSNVNIKPFTVIENCIIGDNVNIGSNVYIQSGTIIGNGVTIESNTVIGVTGVAWTGKTKIPCIQTGNVIIEDNVFIGANASIVRGLFKNKPTIIGKNSYLAINSMIGHGCVIKSNNHLALGSTLAGSVTLNENCFLGAGCCIIPQITIPKNSIIGANSVVIKNYIDEGKVFVGNPAIQREPNKLIGVPNLI